MIRAHLIKQFNWDESFHMRNDVFNEVLNSLGLLDKLNEDCVGILILDEDNLKEIEKELKSYTSPRHDQEEIDECYAFLTQIRKDMKENHEQVARYYIF